MDHVVYYLDKGLIALIGLTLALILWKVLDLWFPRLFRTTWEKRFGTDALSLGSAVESLEEGMAILSVIASATPFIGLVGTIIHIMDALKALNGAGADMSLISGPISVALNTTLIGLASAIPAFIAYNLLLRRIQLLENKQQRVLALAAANLR
ncbi:MAG: MotA/TolQ/ExbB proton channel family protein [Agitococcus sp.]|nr:MotA/TolQ/ExbB proton channel family protein [Agitococcus sp.]MDO9177050.1 MotA/TolQ/ExbB proton channel family protein [Agitococcus sp.]